MGFSLASAVSSRRSVSVSGFGLDGNEIRFRLDIEGLRALAVVLVIADHLFGWPRGGFVGVDVFFVISGFLITGLLLKDLEANDRISFRKFYVRRVRRIIPIAILVLAVTTAASWVVFVQARAVQTSVDAGNAAAFFANWHYAFTGSDYFAVSTAGSPLLHYWSLSVEEQYYLVWPSALLLLALLGRRAFRNRLIFGLTVAAIVISFTWAIVQGNTEPAIAYYSTFTRAWELGIGALLAVTSAALARTIPLSMRPALAWGGLALICASAAFISTNSAFPGPWAALPVLGTATVIVAGIGGRTSPPVVLTNPVSAYVGRISYSLYLWHYPVIVILAAVLPRTLSYFAVCLALMTMLSIVSFHSLEDPIRRSRWLDSKKVVRPDRSHSTSRQKMPRTVLLALLALFTGGVVAVAMQTNATVTGPLRQGTSAFGTPTSNSPSSNAETPGALPPESALALARQRDVQAALASSQWPELDVSREALNWSSVTREAHCSSPNDDVPQCIFGNPHASKKVVVVGDSISLAWLPAIRGALEPQGWQVTALYRASCPSVPVKLIDEKGNPKNSCDTFHKRFPAVVAKMAPDLVITSNMFTYYAGLASRAAFPAALIEWQNASEVMTRSLAKSTPRVAILATPPGGSNIAKCMTRFNSPTDCESPLSTAWQPMSDASQAAVRNTASSVINVKYIDTLSWFCAEGRCPAFIGKSPVTADGEHLSPGQAASLKNLLAEAIGK